MKIKITYQNNKDVSIKDKMILFIANTVFKILPNKLKMRLIKDLYKEGVL